MLVLSITLLFLFRLISFLVNSRITGLYNENNRIVPFRACFILSIANFFCFCFCFVLLLFILFCCFFFGGGVGGGLWGGGGGLSSFLVYSRITEVYTENNRILPFRTCFILSTANLFRFLLLLFFLLLLLLLFFVFFLGGWVGFLHFLCTAESLKSTMKITEFFHFGHALFCP